jgi:hypothetical protein
MKNIIANIIWFVSTTMNDLKYKLAINDIEKTQKKILFNIISKNKNSEFGKKYNFSNIKNINDWQEKLPITQYEDYIEYIELIKKGKQNILSQDRVLILEPTSGSSGPSKLIPYTSGLQKEFQKAIDPWLFDLFTKIPRLLLGKHYWSISPVSKIKQTDSTVLIGFASDEEYLGPIARFVANQIKPVPSIVKEIQNIDYFKYVTLLFLLKTKNLVFVSIWHPSFLSLLLEKLPLWHKELVEDIRNGTLNPPNISDSNIKKKLLEYIKPDKLRARELEKIFSDNIKAYKKIWPKLKVISSWQNTDKLFPDVLLQEKGLISTEAIISFPLLNKSGKNLAINSHFFEFKEKEGSKILLAHQLEKNKYYEVIVTSINGFCRYKIGDTIKVVGFDKKCPLIEFVGRSHKVSDIRGEKLNEIHVNKILKNIYKKYNIIPSFAMLAPVIENNKIFYALFLELEDNKNIDLLKNIKQQLESNLRENFHYNNCRNLEQLKDLKIFLIRENNLVAQKIYIDISHRLGQNLGDIKPVSLSNYTNWLEHFPGEFLNIKL